MNSQFNRFYIIGGFGLFSTRLSSCCLFDKCPISILNFLFFLILNDENKMGTILSDETANFIF